MPRCSSRPSKAKHTIRLMRDRDRFPLTNYIDHVSLVAFDRSLRYIRYTMPKVAPNRPLLDAIEEVVTQAGGNESEAARRLGISRLRVNRIRKLKGGATPAVRNELWKRLKSLDSGKDGLTKKDTTTIQSARDVPGIALQVLRYMVRVLERDIGTEGHPNAH